MFLLFLLLFRRLLLPPLLLLRRAGGSRRVGPLPRLLRLPQLDFLPFLLHLRRVSVLLGADGLRDGLRQLRGHDRHAREPTTTRRLCQRYVPRAVHAHVPRPRRRAAARAHRAKVPETDGPLGRAGDEAHGPAPGAPHDGPALGVVHGEHHALHPRGVGLRDRERGFGRGSPRVVAKDVAAFQPEARQGIVASLRHAHHPLWRVENARDGAGLRARDRQSGPRHGRVGITARGEGQELGLGLELGLVSDSSLFHVPHGDVRVSPRGHGDQAAPVHGQRVDPAAVRLHGLESVPLPHGPDYDVPVDGTAHQSGGLPGGIRAVKLHA
mmetsp:Transcript_8395/g.38075  ORF Transcript_8395/g.38075 Transcript_8395/m.38075 type:complete len:325 (+) Transcript_8395:606-1580(+)